MASPAPGNDRLSDLSARALAALATDASAATTQRLDERLRPLAAELLLEWLCGEKRFETQSQQTEYWLSRFYDEIFTDEQPDATRIYARFGLTLPRAGYVARLLRARGTARWRQAARAELATQLKARQASARQEQKDGQAHIVDYDLGLSAGAADELRVLYDRLVAAAGDGERPRPPKVKPNFGGLRWFAMPADTLLKMLALIEPGKTSR